MKNTVKKQNSGGSETAAVLSSGNGKTRELATADILTGEQQGGRENG